MAPSQNDLATFLRARLDEDDQVAKRSIEYSGMHLNGGSATHLGIWNVEDRSTGTFVVVQDQWNRTAEVVPTYGGMHTDHIARHDPARVLAEIAAKRQILDEHFNVNEGSCGTCVEGKWGYPTHGGSLPQDYPCPTLRLLALPYADHPDYRDEWRPATS